MNQPKVSVVVATRNRPDLLEQALQSIKAQTFQDFEVYVVDDGSNQETLDQYERIWADLDVRFRLQRPVAPDAPGTGPAAARNRGIGATSGELVAFLDDDDTWSARDHLEVGVRTLRRTRSDYFFANMRGHRDGKVEWPEWFPRAPELLCCPLVEADPPVHQVSHRELANVLRHHIIHPDSTIVRRSLLRSSEGFWERVRVYEDYELMMRLADRAGTALYRPQHVVSYRLPSGNSVSLSDSRLDFIIQGLACAQRARCLCRSPIVRRSARAREAWAYRELSQELLSNRLRWEAVRMAWQAVATYPTLGGALFFARTAAGRAGLPPRDPRGEIKAAASSSIFQQAAPVSQASS